MAPSAAQETVSLPSGGLLTLPPTRPGARHFSGLPSTRPSFNTHSSRSGSVQRILSAVPAPALSHSADFLWGRAPPIECSSLSEQGNQDLRLLRPLRLWSVWRGFCVWPEARARGLPRALYCAPSPTIGAV